MEGPLIEDPAPTAPERPSAGLLSGVEDIVERRAHKAGCSRTAIFREGQPESGGRTSQCPQNRLMDRAVDLVRAQAAEGVCGRHGQRKGEVVAMVDDTSARPSADERTRAGQGRNFRPSLGVAEGQGGGRPAIEAEDRGFAIPQQDLVHRHLGGRGAAGHIVPDLQIGKWHVATNTTGLKEIHSFCLSPAAPGV